MHRRGLGFLGSTGYLNGGQVDRGYQVTQLVNGVVDGVSDGTGEVFGYRRSYCQVTVCEVSNFVEQSQNRRLVPFVFLGGGRQTTVGFPHHHQADEDNRTECQSTEHITNQSVDRTTCGQIIKADSQLRGFVQKGLRNGEDHVRRLTHLEQFRRGFENFIYRTRHELEQLGNFRQALKGFLVAYLGNFHGRVAFQHGRQYTAEQACITTKHVSGLHRVLVTGEYLVHRTQDTFSQQGLALSNRDLSRRRTAFQQDIDDFFVLDLQLRNGFRQGGRYLVQRQYGLFVGQDGVGVLPQRIPVLLHHSNLRLQGFRRCRQPGFLVTVGQITPASLEVVAGVAQQSKRFGRTGCRFRGVFCDTLGQYAQLTGVTDVLRVVVGLSVDVGEVGEQQHDRNDQDNKQPCDQCATARTC